MENKMQNQINDKSALFDLRGFPYIFRRSCPKVMKDRGQQSLNTDDLFQNLLSDNEQ